MSQLYRMFRMLSPLRFLIAVGIVAALLSVVLSEQATNASLPRADVLAAKSAVPPLVYQVPEGGGNVLLGDAELFGFEQRARKMLTGADAPDEVFVLACNSSMLLLADPPKVYSPRSLFVLTIKGKTGILLLRSEFGEKESRRNVSAQEILSFREVLRKNDADHLPRLESERLVRGEMLTVASGTMYVYLHLTAKEGRHVWMNNPPTPDDTDYPPGDWLWRYSEVVAAFAKLEPPKGSAGEQKEDANGVDAGSK